MRSSPASSGCCTDALRCTRIWRAGRRTSPGARKFRDLPPTARSYIRFIEEAVGVQVGWVSVGPERSQLVIR